MLAESYQETQAVWTTAILALILLSIEGLNFMLMFINKQAKAIRVQMDEIKEMIEVGHERP